jgi:leucyl-tRNA synthetase
VLAAYVKLLAPFAPYSAQELWELMGHAGPVFKQPWPVFDAALALEDAVEVPVQVNGKLRGKVTVALDISKEELETVALANDNVRVHTDGKQIVKVVVIPGKLVNVVVK